MLFLIYPIRDSEIRPQNSYQKIHSNIAEAYQGPLQTSRMECFVVLLGSYKPLTVVAKRSILDV